MPAITKLVARKTVTHVQAGSAYKDTFTLPFMPDEGSTVRMVMMVSDGAEVAAFDGEIVPVGINSKIEFREPYQAVETVPNGAVFYIYLNNGGEAGEGEEDMLYYGSVFRREHVFPNSPAIASQTVVRQFEDSFQRPAGSLGGRWKTLVGRPVIFDNVEFWTGTDRPNTVGPQYAFFSRYFCYYYIPFNDDSVELSISCVDKGPGKTIISLCQNSSASSYLYLGFDSDEETVEMGWGTSPDIGSLLLPTNALEPQIDPVPLTINSDPDSPMDNFKLRYDDSTKKMALYNDDLTDLICEWTDAENVVPHGKGYRYFGIGGNSGILNSGVQLAKLKAQGIV